MRVYEFAAQATKIIPYPFNRYQIPAVLWVNFVSDRDVWVNETEHTGFISRRMCSTSLGKIINQ